MNIGYSTLLILKQHKLLRGSLMRRMRERNPMDVDAAFKDPLFNQFRTFLAKYTEEEIAKSGYWSCVYARHQHERFREGEPVMRRSGQWKIYLYDLRNQANNQEDIDWANGESVKMWEEAYRREGR